MNKHSFNNINHKNSPCNFDTWDNYLGACFLNDGDAFFRLFTFPETKNVILEVKVKSQPIKKFNMNNVEKGIWQLILPKGTINHLDRYRFVIDYNNELIPVKDPCSLYQDTYFKWSIMYNHSLFNWSDSNWMCNNNSNRVSRLASDINRTSSVSSLRIYEMHIGTFTKEGTFSSAKNELYKIAELKFNAIEIMPVENTYSFNWGYDGVDKYAPNHTYGSPDDLKELINTAHELELNVIMDVVPNHLGPDIAQLQKTGPYIECDNCFGYKFNYEKDDNSKYVRDFIIGASLNWLINYHCDGLRVDMTKFMCSDFTMKQMTAEINYHCPDAFLIAEDGRDNDDRVTKPFTTDEIQENELHHERFINKIRNNDVSLANLGFDTEWDFPFHKQIASMILGTWDCRIKNIASLDYSLRSAQSRVKYPMSHDEIGNIDGTRLITKIMVNELDLNDKVCECCHSLKCKIAAHSAHRLLTALLDGSLENMPDNERIEFYKANNLQCNFSIDSFLNAVQMHKLAIGKVYSIPGPKMIFQGDESADISYFKFFRKFSTGPEPYLKDKGYEPGLPAFLDSKLNSVVVSDKYKFIFDGVKNFVKDLNILCERNISLSQGHIEKTFYNESADIHAVYTRKIYNEIVSISNFSNVSYDKNYGILFPKGQWREILNSDNLNYSGEGKYLNHTLSDDYFKYISLPAYGIAFFERIG